MSAVPAENADHLTVSRPYLRRYRYRLNALALALADVLMFATADILFRASHAVPAIMFFRGTLASIYHQPIDVFATLCVLFVVIRYVAGDYSRRQLFWDSTRQTTTALIIAAIPDLFFVLLSGGVDSKIAFVESWGFLLIAIPTGRQLVRVFLARLGVWHTPTALVGAGPRSEIIFAALTNSISLGFDVRWIVLSGNEALIPTAVSELSRIYAVDAGNIAHRMAAAGCDQAVVAAEDIQTPEFADIVQRLMEANVEVAIIPTLQRLPVVGLSTSHFLGRDVLLLQVRNNLKRLPHRFLKRTFDFLGALVLLILLSPFFALISCVIWLADGGPIIYSPQRVGRHGTEFRCKKFRTMACDAEQRLLQWRDENPVLYEEYMRTFKLRDDPRVTAPGRWLRRTSLDELPQLINVLRGEMSLVGPRPVLEQELRNHYGPAAQLYVRVRPGMTGLWQISGRSNTSYAERVVYDEWYILNWSLWYDIVILIQTVWIVLMRKGAI